MARSIFTRALNAAAAAEGGCQALAGQLRVPQGTLLRWMSGRSLMPLRAFSKVMAILAEHERRHPDEGGRDAAQPPILTFGLNNSTACCASCGSTEFVQPAPASRLRYGSTLACRSCGKEVVHASLLVEFVALYAARHGSQRKKETASTPARSDPSPAGLSRKEELRG